MRRALPALLAFAPLVASCASSTTPTTDGVDVGAPSSTETAHTAPTTAETPASAAPATSALAASGDACLMLYECGCNSGCVSVEKPRRALREGDIVRVKTGGLRGKDVFVAKTKSATGEELLTVSQRDPKEPIQVCGRPVDNALGYLCASDGLGPPHGCVTCPSE